MRHRETGTRDDAGERSLREERVVEIGAAVVVGALVGLGPVLGLWLFGSLAAPPRGWWDAIVDAARPLAPVLGALATLWWLVRARRRGL